jgi:hypothetical protein
MRARQRKIFINDFKFSRFSIRIVSNKRTIYVHGRVWKMARIANASIPFAAGRKSKLSADNYNALIEQNISA